MSYISIQMPSVNHITCLSKSKSNGDLSASHNQLQSVLDKSEDALSTSNNLFVLDMLNGALSALHNMYVTNESNGSLSASHNTCVTHKYEDALSESHNFSVLD